MTSIPEFPPRHLLSEEDERDQTVSAGQAESKAESEPASAPLALPAPQDGAVEEAPQYTLREDGSVLMDKLGPMLNTDGTISRIHNWSSMSASEQERTLRVLGKRNAARRAALAAAETSHESANDGVPDDARQPSTDSTA